MAAILSPNLASPQFKADPHPFYARLRAEAPVYRATLPGRQPAWLVTRYDDVSALLKDARFVKDRRNLSTANGPPATAPWVPAMLKPLAENMLDLDAPAHTRLRALVHKAFTPARVAGLQGRIEQLCDDLLARVRRAGRIELIHQYALPIPTTIIAELLGIPAADRHRFHAWSARIVTATNRGPDMLRALPAAWQLVRYVRGQVAARRAQPGDDLLSALVQAEDGGDTLSADELLAMVIILLIAGHETTVNAIGSGILTLLQNPAVLEELRADPALLPGAVEELLRYCSPVEIATERYAREDRELGGVPIRRGDLVLGVLASANRDERQFADPDRIDIRRTPNRHLAFGQGAHYCVGAPLARLETQIALRTVIQQMPALRLATAPTQLRWQRGVFLRGVEQLPLAF
ncbi:MAG TPA: cytochrome P450 [Chloroflexia bacterium]|nr:cytochrome P450 [Chloroflexia bacterium]